MKELKPAVYQGGGWERGGEEDFIVDTVWGADSW